MNYETFLYEKEDNIGIITLNRPQRLNAINLTMIRELSQVLDEIMQDDEVRVIIFTGASRPDGRPCFSAGGDLKESTQRNQRDQLAFSLESNALENRIEELEKPTIGAIDGVCTAGGLETVLVFDILVASETAQISDLHMKNLGSIGGAGNHTRLCRAVGPAKAKEILWTGIPIDGNEAYRIGLVNKVFPPEKLIEGAKELAHVIASMRPTGLKWSKRAVNAAVEMPTHQSFHFEQFCRHKVAEGRGREGIKAFAEKRKPDFKD